MRHVRRGGSTRGSMERLGRSGPEGPSYSRIGTGRSLLRGKDATWLVSPGRRDLPVPTGLNFQRSRETTHHVLWILLSLFICVHMWLILSAFALRREGPHQQVVGELPAV